MEIIVNDTNIFIDLHSIGLLSQLCDLPYEIRTVDFVMAEIVDNRQQEDMGRLVKEGKITVESFTAEELIEIVNEHVAVSGNLSIPDCSVRSLSSYLAWYAENNDVHSDNAAVSKRIYDRIVFLWIPPIENLFPGVIKTNENITIPACDNKDPKGYNSPYEQVGEHYRSIRYDIIENKDYPHLTNDEIYRRLKELAAPISAEGVKIAMILNIAIKHRLLLKKPQGKSLVRELGMTCTNAAVIHIIASPDEHFYIDEWGREMEAKLLKQ